MSESLSITYIVPHDPMAPGSRLGASVSTREIAVEMARRGHDVTLVHSYVGASRRLIDEGVQVYAVPNHEYPYVGGFTANSAVARFLSEFGRTHKGDIIDARGAGIGWAFKQNSRLWHTPVFHPVDIGLAEWRSLPFGGQLATAPKYFMLVYNEKLCVEVAHWIVVETTSGGQELGRLYPDASHKWTALPPPIPQSWAPRKDTSYDRSRLLFIGAGPRRDTELFLNTLHLLSDQGLQVTATIVREERQQFRELASRWRLKVRFARFIPETEMREAMAGSCAFVLPSHREAYCRSVVEAAYLGTPSVVSDLPSVREFVHDGQNGIVVSSWDPEDWARALELLIRDSGLRNRLGDAAKVMATENYSAERIGNLTEKGYRDALVGRGPHHHASP
ncbi:MAG: glycosyltransferase family 4 protein [Thermoplasmata archaeon]